MCKNGTCIYVCECILWNTVLWTVVIAQIMSACMSVAECKHLTVHHSESIMCVL